MPGTSPNPALDGQSRVGEIVAILSVASVLSTLVVTLRCYCRLFILNSFGIDDAVIVPAQVRAIGVKRGWAGLTYRVQILTLASAVAIGLGTEAHSPSKCLSVLTRQQSRNMASAVTFG